MNSILEFTDISRSYQKGTPVLDGVSFSIAPGEVVGLLGRNGAGKTTLIRIAMGVAPSAFSASPRPKIPSP
jgi:ABC-type multidrug transport system ATPase subunit